MWELFSSLLGGDVRVGAPARGPLAGPKGGPERADVLGVTSTFPLSVEHGAQFHRGRS